MKTRNKNGFVAIILVLILVIAGFIWLFGYIISSMFSSPKYEINEKVATIVINYLNKKYGDQKFTVSETKTRTAATDTIGLHSEEIGFTVKIRYPLSDDEYIPFDVWTRGTDPSNTKPEEDSFLTHYYASAPRSISNYAETGYTISPSYDINDKKTPDNLGHIPDVGELYTYGIIDKLSLYQEDSKSFGDSDTEIAENLRKFGATVADYLKVDDISIALFTTSEYKDTHHIEISKTSIVVKIGYTGEPSFTFDR